MQNRFSRWGPSWISIRDDFNPMLPIKFQVNWPFGSGEELQNRFSRRWPGVASLDFQLITNRYI